MIKMIEKKFNCEFLLLNNNYYIIMMKYDIEYF